MTMTIDTTQCYAEDVKEGQRLPTLERRPTHVQVFRYSAMTWNSHRIHFDKEYAASEGYPDVLVQSHLHGAFLTSLVDRFAGDAGQMRRLYYAVRRFAVPGDVLTLEGEVTRVEDVEGGRLVSIDIREVRAADHVVCAEGDADVFLPNRPTTNGHDR